MKLKEQLFGIGNVFANGENLGKIKYALYVYQEIHIVKGEEIEGLKDIIGRIDSNDAMKFFDKSSLTLMLEDGRCIDFFVRDTDGEIRCSGDFFKRTD